MTRPAAVAAYDVLDALVDALDLAEDRIERMLQRAVDGVPLRRPELVEVGVDALARLRRRLPVAALKVARDLFAREHRPGDFVEHQRHPASCIAPISQQSVPASPAARAAPGHLRLSPSRSPGRSPSVNSVVVARAAEVARADLAGAEHRVDGAS